MVYVKLTGPGSRDPGGCSEGLVPLSCIRGTRHHQAGRQDNQESGKFLIFFCVGVHSLPHITSFAN